MILPVCKSPTKKISLSTPRDVISPVRNIRHAKSNGLEGNIRVKHQISQNHAQVSRSSFKLNEEEPLSPLKLSKIENDYKRVDSDESEMDESGTPCTVINFTCMNEQDVEKQEAMKLSRALNSQLLQINFNNNYQRILGKQTEMGVEALRAYRKSFNSETKKGLVNPVV